MAVRRAILAGCAVILVSMGTVRPLLAQQQSQQVQQVASSSAGQAGQLQTASQTAPGIKPTARFDNRIANRVQSRLYNRIDPYYDPQQNTLTPFVAAGKSVTTPSVTTP